jgi:hypothetical protein
VLETLILIKQHCCSGDVLSTLSCVHAFWGCPYTLSPFTLSPVTLSRSLCPLVTLSPVTLSPSQFVPWSFWPRSLCPGSLSFLVTLSPVTLSPGHFCPLVSLSPGHFVPWSHCPRSLAHDMKNSDAFINSTAVKLCHWGSEGGQLNLAEGLGTWNYYFPNHPPTCKVRSQDGKGTKRSSTSSDRERLSASEFNRLKDSVPNSATSKVTSQSSTKYFLVTG